MKQLLLYYQPLPFYEKNLKPHFFENCENSNPLLCKRGIPTMRSDWKLKKWGFKVTLYDSKRFIFLKVLILERLYFTGWTFFMYNIRKNKNHYFKLFNKSIMASQKCKRYSLAEFFCILECLLTQKQTNQGSQLSWFFQTIWKTIRKSKNRGL